MYELPAELVAKMEAAKTATNERCPVCKAGVGRFCVDVDYAVTINGVHPQRTIWAEADELTRAAYAAPHIVR
jgi:hypothetical protein